jgi:hypothetical protein
MKILKILVILALLVMIFGFTSSNISGESRYDEILNDLRSERYIPISGVVPDEATAIKMAELIWNNMFSETILNKKPFKVKYYKKEKIWLVEGTLDDNMVGGVPYILIRKSDGRVISVWHTK